MIQAAFFWGGNKISQLQLERRDFYHLKKEEDEMASLFVPKHLDIQRPEKDIWTLKT